MNSVIIAALMAAGLWVTPKSLPHMPHDHMSRACAVIEAHLTDARYPAAKQLELEAGPGFVIKGPFLLHAGDYVILEVKPGETLTTTSKEANFLSNSDCPSWRESRAVYLRDKPDNDGSTYKATASKTDLSMFDNRAVQNERFWRRRTSSDDIPTACAALKVDVRDPKYPNARYMELETGKGSSIEGPLLLHIGAQPIFEVWEGVTFKPSAIEYFLQKQKCPSWALSRDYYLHAASEKARAARPTDFSTLLH